MMRESHPEAVVVSVRVGETNVGRGLFVTRSFEPGEELFEFRGRMLHFADTLTKGERECDAFQIGSDIYLDLEPPAVYINHSCDPNTGVRDDVILIALRSLHEGEEIRYDYSTTMDEDHWELECRCGSPNCRGRVRDFKWLPHDRKLELLKLNVVPRYIIDSEVSAGRLSLEEAGRPLFTVS